MDIYDFHAHIYPDKVREKALLSIADNYEITIDFDGTVDNLLKVGGEAGISKFVALPVAVSGRHVESVNDYALSEQKLHKEIIAFGSMHADYEDKVKEIRRIKDIGLHGVKLHPDSQGFRVDDERMFPVYQEMSDLGLPLVVHCGDYRYDFDNPERLANVIDAFPKLTVVAAHFGGWLLFDRAVDALLDKNCYLDCSSSSLYTGKRRFKELIRTYGAERIVFGTDYPMWDPRVELQVLYDIGLKDSELQMILCDNAKRILGV